MSLALLRLVRTLRGRQRARGPAAVRDRPTILRNVRDTVTIPTAPPHTRPTPPAYPVRPRPRTRPRTGPAPHGPVRGRYDEYLTPVDNRRIRPRGPGSMAG
ncbi:hypothetical protein ACIQRK_04265 [Streptomyces anulatus]